MQRNEKSLHNRCSGGHNWQRGLYLGREGRSLNLDKCSITQFRDLYTPVTNNHGGREEWSFNYDTHCTSAGIGGFMVLVAIKVNLSKADT